MRGVLFSTLFINIAMSVFSQCPKKLAYDDYHANITNTTMTSSEIGWDGTSIHATLVISMTLLKKI